MRSQSIGTQSVKIIGLACVATAALWWMGSRNASTPAGYVGYVTRGAVIGRDRFIGTQQGPTSTGRGWLLNVVNVSITPYTYAEDFTGARAVLSHDNLKVGFAVHMVWRVNPDRVQDFVEHYTTLGKADEPDQVVRVAYENFLREPLRTFALDEIQRFDGLAIKDHIAEIGDAIKGKLDALCGNTPFEVTRVVVGNIEYPREVADAVSEKLAATQVLERRKTEILIAEADAQRRVAEAKGIANSMEIINQKLTTTYLQHEAIEAQKMMVNGPNHTVIYLPTGPMGVPVTSMMNVDSK